MATKSIPTYLRHTIPHRAKCHYCGTHGDCWWVYTDHGKFSRCDMCRDRHWDEYIARTSGPQQMELFGSERE
ncbi:MAG: hypothetical protein F4Y39_21165 [Gemmatimonadetes bacterium]|nr:hypothetical protein [Gemmatimonadota bacterium]MYF75627.1 hypothetical protein [Gemmatimonadota bacterium]